MKEPNLIIENLKAILEECTASEDAVSYVNSEDAGTLKAAIEALEKQEQAENEWCPDCAEYDKERHCCHRFTKVIRQTVEECKREWANEGWIPVTERLPEENGRYIICYEDATTFLDYFNGKWFFPLGKHAMACEETGTIVAWRPLPEAYTEEEFEEDRNER